MKKIFLLLLLILFSCQKDELIIPTEPHYNTMIFETTDNIITDGQEITFELNDINKYTLAILNNESVITKETFESTIGLNTRKIYTKTLQPNQYKLVLQKGSETINTTFIIVE